MKISRRVIPVYLFLLLGFFNLSGCSGGISDTPVNFSGGLLELTPDDWPPVPRMLMIQGDCRPVCSPAGSDRYLSPWVTLPRDGSLEFGYSFFLSTPDPGVTQLDQRHITARFRARLHIEDHGTEDLVDRTAASSEFSGWQDKTFDLSAHAGRTVRLELACPVVGENTSDGPRDVEPVFSVPFLFTPAVSPAADGGLLLLISLDSLRADALGCAGYHRTTSPHLDRFSRESVHYATCLSPSPWTRPSHMSLLTSLYPQVHGLDRSPSDLDLSHSFRTWAEVFREAGFQTQSISGGGFMHPSRGFERGFRSARIGRKNLQVDGRRMILSIRKWRKTDLFLFLHSFSTHTPYHLHGGLDYHSAQVTSKMRRVVPGEEQRMSADDTRQLRRYYDDGIFYADHCLGRLFRTLRQEGLYDRAMIVILSDHGEAFREHGIFGHSTQVYENLLKVPLLVKYPSDIPPDLAPPPGTVVHRPVELIDLLPTATEVYGIDSPSAGQFTGRSLLEPGARDWCYAETYQKTSGLKSIRTGNLSYVVHPSSGREELYDLATDPDQRHNLAAQGRDDDLDLARARLGLADSLRRAGLHLAAGGGRGGELAGRLRADCRITEVTTFFPPDAGTVELSADSRELRFVFHRPGKIPLDLGFALEDPGALMRLSLDPGPPDRSPGTILIGPGGGGGALPVSGEDPGLILGWNHFPQSGAPGEAVEPWVRLYRRSRVLASSQTASTDRETAMLEELGYLE